MLTTDEMTSMGFVDSERVLVAIMVAEVLQADEDTERSLELNGSHFDLYQGLEHSIDYCGDAKFERLALKAHLPWWPSRRQVTRLFRGAEGATTILDNLRESRRASDAAPF